MVFSINPTAAETQAMFVANAMNQTSVVAPASLTGMGVSGKEIFLSRSRSKLL